MLLKLFNSAIQVVKNIFLLFSSFINSCYIIVSFTFRLFGLTPIIQTSCESASTLAVWSDTPLFYIINPWALLALYWVLGSDFQLWLSTPVICLFVVVFVCCCVVCCCVVCCFVVLILLFLSCMCETDCLTMHHF